MPIGLGGGVGKASVLICGHSDLRTGFRVPFKKGPLC